MLERLRSDFEAIPLWLFIAGAVCSLLIGVGLRRWMDKREEREKIRLKEKQKEIKAQMKRAKKKAKKGGGK